MEGSLESEELRLPNFVVGGVIRETDNFRIVMDWKPGVEEQIGGERFFIEPLTNEGQSMLRLAVQLHRIGNFNKREVILISTPFLIEYCIRTGIPVY